MKFSSELPRVVDAVYSGGHRIELTFNDGAKRIVDLGERFRNDHRAIFRALIDIENFKRFQVNTWTVEWFNGADLAPELLYEIGVEVAQNEA